MCDTFNLGFDEFQFLIGSLEAIQSGLVILAGTQFQFLIGSLEAS